jgi:hypothetical protein
MTMPQHFLVAVISERHPRGGEVAAAVTSLFGFSGNAIEPYLAACASHKYCRPALPSALTNRGLVFYQPIAPSFLNPKEVHLWLALDPLGASTARQIIKEFGRSRKGFYRLLFPDPVVGFGAPIPDPETEERIPQWIDMLVPLVQPWKQRIWDAFGDSG